MTVERVRSEIRSPPGDDAGVPDLVELVRGEIERDGPITFARFMELALYEPGLGYYATSADRTTRAGDFLTAPELHPIFGWTLALQFEEMWERLARPTRFVLREYGAGTGALGRQVREGLEQRSSPPTLGLTYEPLETEGRNGGSVSAKPVIGCVVANEFLDALPFHRVRNEAGVVRELKVGWNGRRFVEVPSDLSHRDLERHAARVPDGQTMEVSLATAAWLGRAHAELERGYVLIIDYGLREPDLWSPARAMGTARAFRGQHVSSDVLSGVGRQDITCHVNLDALERDARAAGFEVMGVTTAARFLLGSGLDDVYRAAREEADREWESAALLRSAVRRLLDTGGLGGYAVVVLAKDVPIEPPLRGLAGPPQAARPQ